MNSFKQNQMIASRKFLILISTFALLSNIRAAEKPDIVFILADDLGYADVGFTGGKEIKTHK